MINPWAANTWVTCCILTHVIELVFVVLSVVLGVVVVVWVLVGVVVQLDVIAAQFS